MPYNDFFDKLKKQQKKPSAALQPVEEPLFSSSENRGFVEKVCKKGDK